MTVSDYSDSPLGFGAALAQNVYALEFFYSLSDSRRRAIIEQARGITSGGEMRNFVNGLAQH